MVAPGNLVKPDAALTIFIDKLRGTLSSKKLDYAAIDGLFAPKVKTFQRSLDPLQPWKKTEDIRAHYLAGAADLVVEQGELPEGAKLPDYRPEAARQILSFLDGGTFGTLKQVPKMVCAPAAWKFDAKAVTAFGAAHDSDAYSLRFFASDLDLRAKPKANAASVGTVPAGALLAREYDKDAPEAWELMSGSNGVKGYRRIADAQELWLSQMHVCFGKVKGDYKITAIFAYGL